MGFQIGSQSWGLGPSTQRNPCGNLVQCAFGKKFPPPAWPPRGRRLSEISLPDRFFHYIVCLESVYRQPDPALDTLTPSPQPRGFRVGGNFLAGLTLLGSG